MTEESLLFLLTWAATAGAEKHKIFARYYRHMQVVFDKHQIDLLTMKSITAFIDDATTTS